MELHQNSQIHSEPARNPLPGPSLEPESRLREAAHLFSIFLRVPILVGARDTLPLENFQQRALFMGDIQPFYQAGYLSGLLGSKERRAIWVIGDALETHALLILAEETAILVGPFVTAAYQEKVSRRVLSRFARCSSSLLLQFKLYWCDLGVCDADSVLRAAHSMLEYAGYAPDDFTTIHSRLPADLDSQENQQRRLDRSGWQADTLHIIEERYATETRMMAEIVEGHKEAAVQALRQLLQRSRPQNGMTVDLWPYESAMAIMRTLIRIAAKGSGLPAVIIDSTSLEYAQKMRLLNGNPKEMTHLYEQMIASLCRDIRKARENGFTALTHQTLHIISLRYAEPLTIRLVAEMLYVSESTLSRVLKADTGHTFTELLTRERLRTASRLLTTTAAPIQEICGQVGFPDQNYFVKVFRRQYNMTPTEYRRAAQGGSLVGEFSLDRVRSMGHSGSASENND